MIKVLYIHHVANLGGASTSLLNLIKSFPEHEVQPLILCPPGSAQAAFRAAGISVISCSGVSTLSSSAGIPFRNKELWKVLRALWMLRSGKKIRQTIREFKPDLVHLNERSMHHAAYLAKKHGLPVVMHARNVANRESRFVHRLCVQLMKRHVDMTIAIDGSVAASLCEVPRKTVIYNPARSTSLGEEAPTDAAAGKTRILFLSILLPVKGIYEFIEAASLLRDRKDLEFVIAGGNSRSPEFLHSLKGRIARACGLVTDLETWLEQKIRRESLRETVSYLGFVKNVEELFSRCHIHVFPSRLNGPSRGIFETGIRGVPSIISLKDRVEDVVKHNVNALIVEENNPKALAEAILKLADNPQLRAQLGQNAKKQYSEQFNPQKSAVEVLSVYKKLLYTHVPKAARVDRFPGSRFNTAIN